MSSVNQNVDFSTLSTKEIEAILAKRKKTEQAKAEKEKTEYEAHKNEVVFKILKTAEVLQRELAEFKTYCHIEMDKQAVKLSEYGQIRSNSKGGFSVSNSEQTLRDRKSVV